MGNFYELYPLEFASYPLDESTYCPMDVPESDIKAYTGQEYTDLQQMQIPLLQKYLNGELADKKR